MDAIAYKRRCSQPDAFRRSQLEATSRVLLPRHLPSAELAGQILRQEPIAKPDLHQADESSDYFSVELDVAQAEQIMEYLVDAEAGSVGFDGQATKETSEIGDLIDAWVRYIDFRDVADV